MDKRIKKYINSKPIQDLLKGLVEWKEGDEKILRTNNLIDYIDNLFYQGLSSFFEDSQEPKEVQDRQYSKLESRLYRFLNILYTTEAKKIKLIN